MGPYTIPDVGAEVYWRGLRPGGRLLLWYEDDDVWHERLALWPVGKEGTRKLCIATLGWVEEDGSGIYVEELRVGLIVIYPRCLV